MYVVCVRQGDKYPEDYTKMLRRMVRAHFGEYLVVIGDGRDADVGLKHGYKGWNAKLELFSPEFPYRPCFFLDLDTYILADCRDMLVVPETLLLIRDFYQPDRGNTGLMVIPENTESIWARRTNSQRDADFIRTNKHHFLQDRFKGIRSYKADKLQNDPMDTRICCFHGRPRPHQTEGWAGDVWRTWTT